MHHCADFHAGPSKEYLLLFLLYFLAGLSQTSLVQERTFINLRIRKILRPISGVHFLRAVDCPPLLLLFLKFLGEKGKGLVLLYRNFLFKSNLFQPLPFFFARVKTQEKGAFQKCYRILDTRLQLMWSQNRQGVGTEI